MLAEKIVWNGSNLAAMRTVLGPSPTAFPKMSRKQLDEGTAILIQELEIYPGGGIAFDGKGSNCRRICRTAADFEKVANG